MKRILLTLFCFLSILSFAQNSRIEGVIVADKETVKLGQVTLFSLPDSTLKKGTYLDSTYFSLNINTGGIEDYYAKISIPGYSDTLINFKAKDSVVNLGIIPMMKSTDLETVDVVFRKEMFKRTLDGITVNVDGTNLQTLTNLFEVLKASPKITSPDDESIEIIGRGSPLILVDRQPIISNDELKAIPASQIEKIEIITNPSAKYKAQGSGNGVIEVFTKSFHLEGYNLTLRGEAGSNTRLKPSGGLNVGLSLKKKKFTLNGYFGGQFRSNVGFGTTEGMTTDDSQRGLVSSYDFDTKNYWQYYSVKAAYNLTEKQRITAGINGYGSIGANANVNSSTYAQNGIDITSGSSISNSDWKWLNNSAFVNYSIETDTNKSNFEINLNYVNKVSTNDNGSISEFRFIPTGEFSAFEIRNDSRDIPNIGELRTTYEHIFDTTGWKLSAGFSYSALLNKKKLDQYNRVEEEWVRNDANSNSYDYQEHIGAAFFEVTKNWDKFGFRAGLRAEYTKLDGYSNSLGKQFMDSSYIVPFPSASLLFEPNDKLGITVFYDSGIDRPQFDNFDPFIVKSDSLNIQYGNPFLRPAIEQTVGIDFDLFYAYNISFSYTHRKDPTSTISFLDESSFLTETTPWNALAQDGLSASLSIPFQASWIQGWNSVWVDYTKYTFPPLFGRDTFYNLTYGVYSYLTFNLPKDFSIMNRFHLNKWGGAESTVKANANWGIRFTKKFNGNNFQIFADIGNIIPPKYKNTTISGNFQYENVSQNRFTTFKLGLYLKFGRLRAPANIQESSSSESDRL